MASIGAPALVGLAIDPIASLVDTAMIGRFCTAADLAGVGVAVSIFNLIARTFNFLNSATTSAVAAAANETAMAGEFNPEMARQAAAALAVGVGVGVCITGLLVVAGAPILGTLGLSAASDGALLAPATRYLMGRALAAPAVLCLMSLQGAFRGARDTVTPLGALALSSLLNIVLDPLFIVTARGGVLGAALATAVSQYVAAVLLWLRLASACGDACALDGAPSLLGLPRPALRDCLGTLRAGSWLTLRTLSISALLSSASVVAVTLDAARGAAHQILLQLTLAASLLADAVAIAGQSLLASALSRGEGGQRRVRVLLRTMATSGLLVGAATAAALALGGPALTAVFSADPAVRAAAAATWPVIVWTQPLYTLAFAVDGMLFGASDWVGAAGVMIGSSLPALLVIRLGARTHGLPAIWAGLGAFMALRSLLGTARIISGRAWKTRTTRAA